MIELIITATFWIGTPDYQIDINATFLLEAPFPEFTNTMFDGFAIPHLVVIDKHSTHPRDWHIKHELGHSRQWGAYGPILPVLYVLSAGQVFEDYKPGDTHHPKIEFENNCPLLTITNKHTTFFPCFERSTNYE